MSLDPFLRLNRRRHHKVQRGSQQVVEGRDQRPGAANRVFETLRAMMFRAEEWGLRTSHRSMSATVPIGTEPTLRTTEKTREWPRIDGPDSCPAHALSVVHP